MTTYRRNRQLAEARQRDLPLRFNRHTGGDEVDQQALLRSGHHGQQVRRAVEPGEELLARP